MNPFHARLNEAVGEEVRVFATGQPFEVGLTYRSEGSEVPYAVFKKISDILRTQNISHSTSHNPGCQTCDWGSSDDHKILVREVPGAVYEELFPELT